MLCGGANNILCSPDLSARLMAQGVTHVPDMIASAGAVVAGIARTVLGELDATGRIERLGDTLEAVLNESLRTGISPHAAAVRMADERLAQSPSQAAKT